MIEREVVGVKDKRGKVILYTFLMIELIFYVIFLWIDICKPEYHIVSTWVKYGGILLCVLYVIVLNCSSHGQIALLYLLFAISNTILADYFLLIEDIYMVGTIFFILVQVGYLLYVTDRDKRKFVVSEGKAQVGRQMVTRMLILISMILVILGGLKLMKMDVDTLVVICIIYISVFIHNIIYSIRRYVKEKERHILVFLTGLLLYFICDIFVGINNLYLYVDITTSNLLRFAEIGMWLFYLPGKVLIITSGYLMSKNTTN